LPDVGNTAQVHEWKTSLQSSQAFDSNHPQASKSQNRSFKFESSSNHEYDSSKPEKNRSWDSSKHSATQWTAQNRNGRIFESMEASDVECR
jgi:hypothetical protein